MRWNIVRDCDLIGERKLYPVIQSSEISIVEVKAYKDISFDHT